MDLLDHTRPEAERAEFGVRFTSFILDQLILFFLGILAAVAANVLDFMDNDSGMFMFFLLMGVYVLYYVMEALTGRTLGKIFKGLVVARDNASPAGILRLLLRFVLKFSGSFSLLLLLPFSLEKAIFVSMMVSMAMNIGCFAVLSDTRQTIYDMVAGTAVYRKSDL